MGIKQALIVKGVHGFEDSYFMLQIHYYIIQFVAENSMPGTKDRSYYIESK